MTKIEKKILIATGIWLPDVGGPATYGWNTAEKLTERGFKVGVVTYGKKLKVREGFEVRVVNRGLNKLFRFFLYFLKVLKEARGAEVIYALDATAAGLPAALTAMILRKKFLIRVGGDLLWERAAEGGFFEESDRDFYEKGNYLKYKPKLFKVIRFVLRRAKRVFVPAQSLKEIYIKFYGIGSEKIEILPNVFEKKTDEDKRNYEAGIEKKIVFAGRLIKYKNLERLIEAIGEFKVNPSEIQDKFYGVNPSKIKRKFHGVNPSEIERKFHGVKLKVKLLIAGEGPEEENLKSKVKSLGLENGVEFLGRISRDELKEVVKNSAAGISVAWTEYNPNFILECLSLGKPVLLSRENGLSVKLPEIFLVNPFSKEEIRKKIEIILDNLEEARKEVKKISFSYTWDDSVNDLVKNL